MGRRAAKSLTFLGLLSSLVLCAAIYYPGLHGGFIFDDWPNIVGNNRLHVDHVSLEGLRQAAFSADAGPLKRPVSMLSFWVNYYTTGIDPFYFKLTNLLIHLANGLGLFWLTRLLLETSHLREGLIVRNGSTGALALIVAAVWLVHPLNLTSVLYVVQRMTSLSASFVILGLLSYVLGRRRLARGAVGFPWILLGLLAFGGLAVLSKENGVLLPFYMAVIEITLFRFSGLNAQDAKKLKIFFLCTAVLPAVAVVAFVLSNPDWLLRNYDGRNFNLTERLMTEARMLWLYLRWALVPTPDALGLFHDDVPISRGLLHPATTLLALGGLLLACGGAIRFRKQAPLFAFAVFWFLTGHLLESSFIGLELVFEHRNYLPLFGPILAGAYVLLLGVNRVSAGARLAVPTAFVACFAAVTGIRAADWSDFDSHSLRQALVRHHPESSRANYEAGLSLADIGLRDPEFGQAHYEEIKTYFERSVALDETAVNGLFGIILLSAMNDRPIDEAFIERLATRLGQIPLRQTVTGAFQSLLDWMRKDVVVLPQPTVLRLFEAALGNPTASHATKATLLSFLSIYYVEVAGDLQTGVSLALAAVEEDRGEAGLRVTLADLAIKLRNFDLAAHELDEIERMDHLGRFTLKRRKLAENLELARSRSEPSGQADDLSMNAVESPK
jgi:hypothetical protein